MKSLPELRARLGRLAPRPLHDAARIVEASSLPRRRLHAYGLGAPRSGTAALSRALVPNYRSCHEPDFARTMRLLQRVQAGITEEQTRSALRWRDRRMRHEMEVSCLLNDLCGPLAAEFPQARFVLMLRDCFSWLDSVLNAAMRTAGFGSANWLPRLFIPERFSFTPYDAPLRDARLFPLDAYLEYWRRTNEHVLRAVPDDRLIVIRTNDLPDSAERLARHLGIVRSSVASLPRSRSRQLRHGLIELLDKNYVLERVQAHCGSLMHRYYPGLSLDDVRFEKDDANQRELVKLARRLGRVSQLPAR